MSRSGRAVTDPPPSHARLRCPRTVVAHAVARDARWPLASA